MRGRVGTGAEQASHTWVTLLLNRRNSEGDVAMGPTSMAESSQQRCVEQSPRTSAPSERYVHQMVAEQARRTPQAIAVELGEHSLTYAELEQRANQFAHWFTEHGLHRDAPVGLLLGRSIDMMVAVLGVLKAGGAYLPLDPAYPGERLRFMIEDSKTRLVVTDARLAQRIPGCAAKLLRVDTDAAELARQPTDAMDVELQPGDIAYVMYTSGSTGQPKGVEMPHLALTHLIQWHLSEPRLGRRARTLQWAALSFDVSLQELFSTWAEGGTLVLLAEEVRQNPAALWRFLCAQSIERLHIPFIVLQALAEVAADPHSAKGQLRDVISAGERLQISPALVRMFERFPDCHLHNHYGPTESHAITAYTLKGAPSDWPALPPVGSALPSAEIYILDENLRVVPDGEQGELFVGGPCLARGYLGRPQLTAERFLTVPLGPGKSSRLYRTGDLAFRRPDGNYEVLGRNDDQVKIRGLRVELGEVEVALQSHCAVREAVVTAREDADGGGRRLVAYLVADPERALSDEQIRPHTESDQVSEWRSVYDQTYRTDEAPDPLFDTRGWNSSYTGKPIPAEEMHEWVDTTVTRILAERPQRVLELGCGTGLLMWRIAPQVLEYWGTDLSGVAIEELRSQLARGAVPQVRKIELRELPADQFDGIPPGHFDVVVLNSVLQLFPSIEYFLRVLAGAMRAVRPGGKVFIGDVQNYRAIHAFHTSVQLAQAQAHLSTAHLIERIERQVRLEQQLMLDPAIFSTGFGELSELIPELDAARVILRRGWARNEMNAFRYDVVLTRRAEPDSPSAQPNVMDPEPYIDWREQGLTLAWLSAQLKEGLPRVRLGRVPNARIQSAVIARELLRSPGRFSSVDALRRAVVAAMKEEPAVDPEELWTVAEAAGFSAELTCSPAPDEASFDAVLTRRDAELPPPAPRAGACLAAPLQSLANRPLQLRSSSQVRSLLVASLRSFLKGKIPEYMVPSAFVILEALPRLPSGKADRRSLPAPDTLRPELTTPYVAPRTPVEKILADIFSEVLQLDRVGLHDQCFELGGDSIIALRIVARANQAGLSFETRDVFEHPTIAQLASLLQQAKGPASSGAMVPDPVSREVRQLLENRIEDAEDIYELAPTQEGMLFHSIYAPDSDVYFNQVALRLVGAIEPKLFLLAWQHLLERHTILRTSFHWTHLPFPLQTVHRWVKLPVHELDWSGLAGAELNKKLSQFLEADRKQLFDLSAPPLMRLALARVAPKEWQLIITIHHLIVDGWSWSVMLSEVRTFYQQLVAGEENQRTLPPAPAYRRFVEWQRQRDNSRAEAYFRELLRGFTAPTTLGIELPVSHAAEQNAGCTGIRMMLPSNLSSSLQSLARKQRLTLNALFEAAWALLLSRYSGSDDVVFGVTVSGRPPTLEGVDELVGVLINTLPVRVQLPPQQTVEALLKDIQRSELGRMSHEATPLIQIQGWSELPRGTPLFESLLIFENFPQQESVSAGFEFQDFRVWYRTNYPLNVMIIPGPAIELRVVYESHRFNEGSVPALLGHFKTLLEALTTDQSSTIQSLPLLTDEEQQHLLIEWNDTAANLGAPACIHELFEAQVARTPDVIAAVCGEQRLTYAELNRRANRLAHQLIARGVKPETFVGLFVERSLEMLIGALGILKAGGAYLPLDQAFPSERLAYFLRNADARLVVTHKELAGRLTGTTPTLCLDEQMLTAGDVPCDAPPATGVRPENLAYLMYTSGSTGLPKGVPVCHKEAVSILRAMCQRPGFAPSDVLLAVTTVSFDISVPELYMPLLVGARVVIAPRTAVVDGRLLIGIIEREGCTYMQATPSTWRMMLDAGWGGRAGFKALCGGEAWPRSLADALLSRCELWNMYGPTEATIWASAQRVEPGTGPVTLGPPLANARIYVLDAHMRPVPRGIAGELYIGGAGIGRGYLSAPALTAARYVPDRFSAPAGTSAADGQANTGRLYRTGDFVRFVNDRALEFIGRKDQQIKIRGFRVELGEIEAALGSLSGVHECAVLVSDDPTGGRRLIAYVATDPANQPTPTELRKRLGVSLPDYMVPAVFVLRSALPHSPNGKIDRQALRASEVPSGSEGHDWVAPVGAIEELIAGIWSQVLGKSRVGSTDHFFDLGGHSLLAISAISRINDALSIELPVRTLFDFPTVAALGRQAARALAALIDEEMEQAL